MTDTTNANGRSPRHMGPTREAPLVGYRPKHDATLNRGLRPAGRNAAANGSNTYVWPAAESLTDADPTRAVKVLPPNLPRPNVTVDPPTTAKSGLPARKAALIAALLIAGFGVGARIATTAAGVS